jgi:hypothetical protein
MHLVFKTASGLPAFKLSVEPSETIAKVTAKAAARANLTKQAWKNMKLVNVKPDCVRLSCGRMFLSPQESVQSLGLEEGQVLKIHVRTAPLIRGTDPQPTFSFAAAGFAFYIRIFTARGSELFRLRVQPNFTIARVVEAAIKRVECSCRDITVGPRPRLRFQRRPLPPDKKLADFQITENDPLVMHGLEGERAVAPKEEGPLSSSILTRPGSASFNALARLSAQSDDGVIQIGAPDPRGPSGHQLWMPVGATNWP